MVFPKDAISWNSVKKLNIPQLSLIAHRVDPLRPVRLRKSRIAEEFLGGCDAFVFVVDLHDLRHAVLQELARAHLGRLHDGLLEALQRIRETRDVSFRALPEAVARLLLEARDELVAMLGGLDFVPYRVEHATLRPIVGLADLAHPVPPRHVREDRLLARALAPRIVDLAEDARVGGRRVFRVEIVDDLGDLAAVDVLAVLVECGASSIDAVGCRESTPAFKPHMTCGFEVPMEAAFAALVTFFFTVADTSGQETSAFACRTGCGETLDFPLAVTLLPLLSSDADAAPRFAFTTTAVA